MKLPLEYLVLYPSHFASTRISKVDFGLLFITFLLKDFHQVAFSINSNFEAPYYPFDPSPINFTVLQPAIGGGVRNEGFEAPIPGIYRFSFSAATAAWESGYWGYTEVAVLKNNKTIFAITDGSRQYSNNLGYTWIWKLDYRDVVSFFVKKNHLQCNSNSPITFTGERID